MVDFQVDINHLLAASHAWDEASQSLKQAAQQADTAKDSHKEVHWGMFQATWDAHVQMAQYIHDRLTEGSGETEAMSQVLKHVADIYLQQDQRFSHVLIKLDGEV